jgi:hypothetical protein
MERQSATASGERVSVRQVVSWLLFLLLVIAGLALFFLNADRIVTMLDVVTDP